MAASRFAAATLLVLLSACSMFNVRSGPGLPAGLSIRTATHIATLVATDEPRPPRLQPNEVQPIPRNVGLLLAPMNGTAAEPMIQVARGVPPDSDVRLIGIAGDELWLRAGKTYKFNLKTRRLAESAAEPQFAPPPPLSSAFVSGVRVSDTEWLGMQLPEDVSDGKLKPGSPFMPSLFPLRTTPYKPLRDSEIPQRERRRLYRGVIETRGPIPRIQSIDPLDATEYSNGAFLRGESGGSAFAVYEGRYPNDSLHVMKLEATGRILWTADTRIIRDLQIMPGPDVLAFRGAPLVESGKFPQPVLVLLNKETGRFATITLRF